jgi:hypothetical protein
MYVLRVVSRTASPETAAASARGPVLRGMRISFGTRLSVPVYQAGRNYAGQPQTRLQGADHGRTLQMNPLISAL